MSNSGACVQCYSMYESSNTGAYLKYHNLLFYNCDECYKGITTGY